MTSGDLDYTADNTDSGYIKLGSLFDGSGGFPLAGTIHGIRPVWASEIEPYPLRVTAARFPRMKQLGDVTKIKGAEIEPVDIITFGSPCQDLSVAGKQKGIHEGERSNLFFEAIRIIREMRENDKTNGRSGVDIRPRFAVWENVLGAFSSNEGRDFQAVLQALCEIADFGVHVPRPPRGGNWKSAGCIVGDGFSIAWRVYDAQYWGVPQRRKRIFLVADFGSERAGEILFERESMRGYPAQSREAREGAAADAEGSAYGGCYAFHLQQDPIGGSVSPCIGGQHQATVGVFMGGQGAKAGSIAYDEAVSPTLRATASGTNQTPDVVYAIEGNVVDRACSKNGKGYCENVSPTMNTQDKHAVVFPAIARTLTAEHDASPCADRGQNVVALDCRNMIGNDEISGTLQAKNEGGFSLNFINPIVYDQQRFGQYGNSGIGSSLKARDYKDATDLIVEKQDRRYIVRRLTPLECCRLQGFPDWWEEGVEGSDGARYKMWGNGIALPCAVDVLSRIVEFHAKEMRERLRISKA